MHVFISWSGDRSRTVAEAIRDWLPMVLQFVDAWMSASDMEKGARWEGEISQRLDAADVGIACLTPENLTKPWILFETGALSKRVSKARVCTVLTDLRQQDVPPPLGMFQHTENTKDDIRSLVHSINKFGGEKAIPEQVVNRLFEATWPDLEARIANLTPPTGPVAQRSTEDMLAEILELSRKQVNAENEQILAKLNCMELAMMYLSCQRNGIPMFGNMAWRVISKSHEFYGGRRDKLQEALAPLWETASEILKLSEQIVRKKRALPDTTDDVSATPAPPGAP